MTSAIEAVPGINPAAIAAAGEAFLQSYAYGLKMTALTSLGFGGFGILMCLLCEDIGVCFVSCPEFWPSSGIMSSC